MKKTLIILTFTLFLGIPQAFAQITITGSIHSGTVNSVGTNTLLNSSGFVVSHYDTPRVVGLWDSSSNFKGIAYVRRYISTTQIELEAPFYDPVDGSEVTQVAGDQYLVSINLTEAAASHANLSVSNNTINATNSINFGNNGQRMSLMLYDEDKVLNLNNNTTPIFSIRGGMVVFGHLIDHAKRIFYNPVNIRWNNAASSGIFIYTLNNASGGYVHYGGNITAAEVPAYIGAGNDTGSNSHMTVFMGISTNADFTSTNTGPWTNNANRQRLIEVNSVGAGTNNILQRWGNGIVEGGTNKLIGSAPLTVFGGRGTIPVSASPGNRVRVLDLGDGNALMDGVYANTIFNFTNVITPARNVERGNGSAQHHWYWNEQYSNLAEGSIVAVQRGIDNVLVDNDTTGSDGIADLTVYEASYSGLGITAPTTEYTDWNYSIRKYEKQLISGQFSRSTISLGSAGSSYDVQFGGTVSQLNDLNITETNKATVDAYTTIDNLDQLYDRAKSWNEDNTTSFYPAYNQLLIAGNGTELDLGNRNLIIDATAASAFAVNTGTNAITIKTGTLVLGSQFSSIKTTGTITLQNGATLEVGYTDSTGTFIYMELTNLDQQDILVTDQQIPSSPVTIQIVLNQSGTYKTHFALPAGGEINVLIERDGYAPWTETIPNGDLNFIREITTSLSSITGANQILTIDLLIKLLQKTEAVLNSVNTQGLPVPTVNVTTNTTSSTGPPSVDNQNVELGILTNILAKLTAIRDAVEQP